MAKLLREQLGFENIKSHMTVLEPADEIMVVGRLEASGYRRKAAGETATAEAGPPTLRKKTLPAEPPPEPAPAALPKKKVLREAAAPPEPPPAPEPVEPAVEEQPELAREREPEPKKQLPRPVARRPRRAETDG